MRAWFGLIGFALVAPVAVAGTVVTLGACGLEQLSRDAGSSATATSDGGDSGAGIVGQGCGVDGVSGTSLCAATSQCPSIVVDTQTFPHCGFRIRGSAVDLICACGDAVCPMGTYATCDQAAALLSTQTEQGVCTQIAEGRCTASSGSASSSSGSNSSGGTCDRQCLAECGGGAGCASVCGC